MQSPPSPDHSLMPLVPTRVTTYSKQKRVRFVLSAASRPTTLHPPIKVCSSWRQRVCSSLSTQSALKVVGKENVPHNVVTPARAVAGKKERHAEEINLSKKKKKNQINFLLQPQSKAYERVCWRRRRPGHKRGRMDFTRLAIKWLDGPELCRVTCVAQPSL